MAGLAVEGAQRLVVALGGNAISPADADGRYETQLATVEAAASSLAAVIAGGAQVVLTHGNGPQVGALLTQQEQAEPPPQPLSVCGAMSQGQIGYMLAQGLQPALERVGVATPVATVLTRTLVAADDPAFDDPTKPIGPWLAADRAEALRAAGATVERLRDHPVRPFRRVVASPEPLEVLEAVPVAQLVERHDVVVCGGGGGVPVVRRAGELEGVDAVVDKDLVAETLGRTLDADVLLFLTDVDGVYRDYGTDGAARLREVTVEELRELQAAGQFPPGSMGPKVTAACRFVQRGPSGERVALVAALEDARAALDGEAGTRIVA